MKMPFVYIMRAISTKDDKLAEYLFFLAAKSAERMVKA